MPRAATHGWVMSEVWFSETGAGGWRVELRLLGADQHLDRLLTEAIEPSSEHLEPVIPEWLTGLVLVEPAGATLSDEETNPSWWVQPPFGPGRLATLSYALGLLSTDLRAAAFEAHLAVLADLVAHERSVHDILAGSDLLEGVVRRGQCAACQIEPELHVEFLAEAVAERARELVEALAQFPTRITLVEKPDGF